MTDEERIKFKELRQRAKLWHSKYALVCLENNNLRKRLNEMTGGKNFFHKFRREMMDWMDATIKQTFERQHPEMRDEFIDTRTGRGK